MRKFLLKSFTGFIFLFFALNVNAQTILYVNDDATGLNNGTSWTNAYTSLESALAIAHANTATQYEIRVAEGVYKPTNQQGGGARDATFAITRSGIKLIGGYSNLSDDVRDIDTNTTILSGDIGVINNKSDNSYHVLVLANIPNSPVDSFTVDGFIVTLGNANGTSDITINGQIIPKDGGGGILSINAFENTLINSCKLNGNSAIRAGCGMYNFLSSPTLINCVLSGNSNSFNGGGMYNYSSSPILINCILNGNSTSGLGGAMFNNGSSPILNNCTVSGNSANLGGGMYSELSSFPLFTNCMISGNNANVGGGIYNHISSPVFTNCIVSGNYAATNGGGFFNVISSPILNNCAVSGNYATNNGGGVYNTSVSNPSHNNSILFGNNTGIYNSNGNPIPTYSYSLVQGLTSTSSGNISATGITASNIFVNPIAPASAPTIAGDYSLKVGSPAINAGSNALIPSGINTDILGNTRIQQMIVDLGAYESNYSVFPLKLLSFTANRTNAANSLIWKTATESNIKNYEVQRSTNAQEFTTIATVAAKNGEAQTYTYNDKTEFTGKLYYRIKINENDGKTEYSKIVTLNNDKQSTINIYPNPAKNNITIQLADNSLINTEAIIVNAQGKTVLKQKIQSTNQLINISALSQGTYFIKFENGEVEKVIKK